MYYEYIVYDGYLFMPTAESLYNCFDPGHHLCETGSLDADGVWSTVHTWPAHEWLARISDARTQYTLASPVRPASGLVRYGALQRGCTGWPSAISTPGWFAGSRP